MILVAITIPLCPDLQAFMDILDQALDYTMEHEVFPQVRGMIITYVYTRVYDKYRPKRYVRWKEYGGLSDINNIEGTYEAQTKTLTVKDVRDDPDTKQWRWMKTGDPDNTVADIVENGGPWSWRVRIGPRPFHQPVEDDLIQTKTVDRWITDGLENSLAGWSY